MSGSRLVWVAGIGNTMVAAVSYATLGWSSTSAHAAARHTAGLSMVWFVAAFATPGLARLVRNWPDQSRLLHAFLGAHLVHFASVALVLTTFDAEHVVHHPFSAMAVVIGGVGLVGIAGLAGGAQASRLSRVMHEIAVYLVFLIFLAAYAHQPDRALRLLVIPIALALPLRLAPGFACRPPQTATNLN